MNPRPKMTHSCLLRKYGKELPIFVSKNELMKRPLLKKVSSIKTNEKNDAHFKKEEVFCKT